MSGIRQRVNAFISWGWDYFGSNRSVAVLDRPDAARIDWGDDDEATPPTSLVDLGGWAQPYSCMRSVTMIRPAASMSAR